MQWTREVSGALLAMLLVCFFVVPAHAAVPADPGGALVTSDVVYGKGGGHPLHMLVSYLKTPANEPRPVIVYIHGGGWEGGNAASAMGIVNEIARHGYFAVSIEYRLTGEARFPAQIEDCKCAVRFLRAKAAEFHIDPQRIGAMGDSAGGHLAALLGTSADAKALEGEGGYPEFSSSVGAVCDLYGPTDFMLKYKTGSADGGRMVTEIITKLFDGTPQQKPELARSASPITYVSRTTPPFLILHGDKDPLVPLEQSQLLVDALKKAGVDVTFRIIRNGGHGGELFSLPQILPGVLAFFDSKLARK